MYNRLVQWCWPCMHSCSRCTSHMIGRVLAVVQARLARLSSSTWMHGSSVLSCSPKINRLTQQFCGGDRLMRTPVGLQWAWCRLKFWDWGSRHGLWAWCWTWWCHVWRFLCILTRRECTAHRHMFCWRARCLWNNCWLCAGLKAGGCLFDANFKNNSMTTN